MRVRAVRRHAVPTRPPLVLAPGDEVEVGERSTEWPEFVFVIAKNGEGWMPRRYLTTDRPRAVATTGYDTTELAISAGSALSVTERDDQSGWWWCEADSGDEGWVPIEVFENE